MNMKKLILPVFLVMVSLSSSAQGSLTLKQDEAVMLYSLPKTEFVIEVTTEKRTETPGQFYKYSERYLATNKVILQEKTSYKVVSVDVKVRSVADAQRTYSFVPDKNSANLRLSLNNQGILCGVNVKPTNERPISTKSVSIVDETKKENSLLPLGEEYMLAGSEAKLAEGAAKQIYRIRESRLGLLTADVEKLPADGASLKAMLEGLTNMEQELTELFVGKTVLSKETKTISLIPDAAISNQVLFRVSALSGVVAADDLSGAPYYINILPTHINAAPADPKAKPAKVILQTLLPAATQLTIGDGIKTVFSREYFVPQFGKTIPVPAEVLSQPNVKIQIDIQTGRLLSVE